MAKKSKKSQRQSIFNADRAKSDMNLHPLVDGSSGSSQTPFDSGNVREDEPAPSIAAVRKGEDGETISPIDKQRLRLAVQDGAWNIVYYTFDVFNTALALLRKPLGLMLFIVLLSIIFVQIEEALHTVISPFCWVPGVSSTPICAIPTVVETSGLPRRADYPRLIEIQGSGIDQLLDRKISGSGISYRVRRTGMAVRDLISLVRCSDLRSKEAIANHMERFVSNAQMTSEGLNVLSARIGSTMDNVMAANDHALHTIEAQKAWSESALAIIIRPFLQRFVEKAVRDTFIETLSVTETQIRRLVKETDASINHLLMLDENLYTLSEFVTRENVTFIAEREELLTTLWTMLGGNKERLRSLDNNLFVLSNIRDYRRLAIEHVNAAMQTLQSMGKDMEELRAHVAAPELVGDKISVEVHIKSISNGLARVQANQERDRRAEIVAKYDE